MALLFCDSGDHYDDGVGSGKWDLGSVSPTSFPGQGRFGTNPILWGWSTRYCAKGIGIDAPELIMGCAMQFHGDENFGGHNAQFMSFYDLGTCQISVWYDITDGVLRLYRGPATTLLASDAYTFRTSSFVYCELRVLFSNTVGEVQFKIDGVDFWNLTGLDTCQSANEYANAITLGDRFAGQQHDAYYDDCYCLDTASGENVDFLGDVRVEPLFPDGNGNSSQWIGSDSDSTDNYLLVDETPPDEDTTFVESGSVGDKDTYSFTDISSFSGTVYGVQPLLYARKTDAAARSIASVARLATTEEDSADSSLTTSYLYARDVRELDPDGADWTITSVNAAEFGQKVTV